MHFLATLGIFLGGLGVFFMGIGYLWKTSLHSKEPTRENTLK